MLNIGIHKEREDAESDEICLERSSSRLGHSSTHSLNEASCQHSTDTYMESAICKPESVPLSFTSEIKSDNCITTVCEFVKRKNPSFDLIQIYNHCTKQWQSTPSQLTQKLLSLLSLLHVPYDHMLVYTSSIHLKLPSLSSLLHFCFFVS